MPSIRVKRSNYQSLREHYAEANPLTHDRNRRTGTSSTGAALSLSRPSRRQTSSGLIVEDDQLQLSTLPQTASRVHHHLLNGSSHAFNKHKRRSLPSFHGLDDPIHHPARKSSGTAPAEAARGKGYVNFPSRADVNEHHDDIVDHLEVIDPQFSTVSNLTHAANAVVFPPLPLALRKPSVAMPDAPRATTVEDGRSIHEDDLDRHIEDCLDRKQKIRRTLDGVWAFIKTPLGFVTAVYGFMIVFWGAGIVFFLGRIINLHNEELQGYWVELTCQVETGLFTLTSVGLIPWRILDTWRIYWIWHYKRKTIRLRREAGLPQLINLDDLPDPVYDDRFVHVLTPAEHADLHYQQLQFMKSQTWYRPHGTSTHCAFSITTALLICLLNDGNSIFQIGLNACMWGLNRFERPAATTATLLPAGFLCGIGSGILIWRGTQKTKRREAVEERLRDALAAGNKYDTHDPAQSSPFGEGTG